MPTLNRMICGDFNRSRGVEWLLSNGRGGFAMGSVAGTLTRRYHGLLVAAPRSPIHRFVMLAKFEPQVRINGRATELSVNDYSDCVHPRGDLWLESFSDEPMPTWRWRIDGALIEQRIALAAGEDTLVALFALIEGPANCVLEVRPLCTSRFYHQLTSRAGQGEPRVVSRVDGVSMEWTGRGPPLHLSATSRFEASPDWYYNFRLAEEAARGQDDRQDLFCPGVFRATLRRGDANGLIIAASTQPIAARDTAEKAEKQWSVACGLWPVAANRKSEIGNPKTENSTENWKPGTGSSPQPPDPLLEPLIHATRHFLVARSDGRPTVLAGYPWFGDWGRDTFISLPGLCLVTGRHEMARQILAAFARHIDGGMIPNRFPDDASPDAETADYNSVDASLWFVHALGRYLDYSGNVAAVESLYSGLRDILTHYADGTRHGICRDEDGLLACGEPGVQLTWMDAKIGDWVVTPRIGKPVEINALWYNALCIGADLARRFGHAEDAMRWADQAFHCETAFNARFWNADRQCLFDVVDVDHRPDMNDGAIRPNQLMAVSLTHPALRDDHFEAVARVVRDRLLTPLGVRTLDPDDSQYQPRYAGDMRARDAAYHQGTAWPWLLGPMVTAWVRANRGSARARIEARGFINGLASHLKEAGLGGISEVADGDAPHVPGGCPWQAWSVAEPLRALAEDLLCCTMPSRDNQRAQSQ